MIIQPLPKLVADNEGTVVLVLVGVHAFSISEPTTNWPIFPTSYKESKSKSNLFTSNAYVNNVEAKNPL